MAIPLPNLKTGTMGGVPNPSAGDLLAMHESPYILHAVDGVLSKVPVQKSRLPVDAAQRHQGIRVAMAGDETVYVRQPNIMCKSADGGRTWTSYRCNPPESVGYFQILEDGTFIALQIARIEGDTYWIRSANVWASTNQGASWDLLTQIERPTTFNGIDYEWWYPSYPLHRLPDDTLLWPVMLLNEVNTGPPYTKIVANYRSTDGGKTWQGPTPFVDWCSEGGMTRTASGKLLAAVRYQREPLPDDPPGLAEQLGDRGNRGASKAMYKHVFLTESVDGGRTWKNFRQLTTVFGQCFGIPAALPDGRVTLVHTTPYGPGSRGSRAMISHDEGDTWQDETYYLTFSEPSGYNMSVVFKDGVVLTVVARNDDEPLTAIRWQPVK